MFVFISDLHFEDGTAGKHNVSSDAFSVFFENLRWHAERRGVSEIELVLLGDVFDLLRTDYWFDVDPDERPWGSISGRSQPLEAHARAVLKRIADANTHTFKTFREQAEALRSPKLHLNITYVPGNHDRLVNRYDDVRRDARRILGLPDSAGAFPERVQCSRHGLIALHGHQFDLYNYEDVSQDNPDGVPIGDPLTTELVTRIPGCVARAVKKADPALPGAELAIIQRTFESLEDVRPMTSVMEWLLSHVHGEPALESAVHLALEEALGDFKRLPFVDQWFDKHDTWNPDDEADKLQWLMWVAGHISLKTARKLVPPLVKLGSVLASDDPYVAAARRLIDSTDTQTRFVVMGHTHTAKQQALGVVPGPGGRPVRRVYLNTGTWRPCHHRCADGSGFLAWKEMSFTMIYAPDERSGHGAPSFETWSGTLDARGVTTCD